MFAYVFSKRKREQLKISRDIFEKANVYARHEVFFRDLGVKDDMTGRFDLLSLVAGLITIRINQIKTKEAQFLSQALFDAMFRQLDHALREGGIGDLSVPKHMKRMMQGFHGRTQMYQNAFVDAVDAVDAGGAEISEADKLAILDRNLYSDSMDADDVRLKQCYDVAMSLLAHLTSLNDEDVLMGNFELPSNDEMKKFISQSNVKVAS